MSTIRNLLGVVAAGCMVMSAAGQEVTTTEGQTVLFEVARTGEPVLDPEGLCGAALYNAPDATTLGTGRTVGTSSGWIPVQGFTPSTDWNVCGLGVDGWYVTGTPTTCNLNIYPDDGSGSNADLSSPLCGNGVDVTMDSDPFSNHYVYGDLADACCLTGGTKYYVAVTPSSPDHWSAVYTHADGSFPNSYSTNNDGSRFEAGPLCVRILGEEGCSGGDLSLAYRGPCPGPVTAIASGAAPGATVGLIYSNSTGGFVIPVGVCAGTATGLGAPVTLFGTAVADGGGNATFSGVAPQAACGLFIQAVDSSTCATSNVEQVL